MGTGGGAGRGGRVVLALCTADDDAAFPATVTIEKQVAARGGGNVLPQRI